MRVYQKPASTQFVMDMDEAGYNIQHYNGRFFWEGPAVAVADHHELVDVIAGTAVRLQWDNLGRGYIVYPVEADPGLEQQQA